MTTGAGFALAGFVFGAAALTRSMPLFFALPAACAPRSHWRATGGERRRRVSPFSSDSCSSPCRIRRPSRVISVSSRSSTPRQHPPRIGVGRARAEPARNSGGPLACDERATGRIPQRVRLRAHARSCTSTADGSCKSTSSPARKRAPWRGRRSYTSAVRWVARSSLQCWRAWEPPCCRRRESLSCFFSGRAQHRHRQRRRLRRRPTAGAVRAFPRHPGSRCDCRRLAQARTRRRFWPRRRRLCRRHRRSSSVPEQPAVVARLRHRRGPRSSTGRPGQFTGAAGLNVPAFDGLATLTTTSSARSPAQFRVRMGGVHVRTMDVAPGETGDHPHPLAGRGLAFIELESDRSHRASGRQSRYACRDDDERNSVVGGIAESCGHRPRAGGRHHAVRRPAAARLVRRQVRHARPSRVGAHRDPEHRAARPGHPAAERALDARAQSLRRRRPHHLHPVRPGDAVLLPAARARAGVSRHGARRTVGTRRPGLRGQPGVSRGLDARHLCDLSGGRRTALARRGPAGGAPDGHRARDGDVGRRRVARRYLHRHHSFLGVGAAQAARTAVARERPRRRRAVWHLVPDENHRDHLRRAGVPVLARDRRRLAKAPADRRSFSGGWSARTARRSASPRQCSRSWSRLIS